MPYKLKQNYEAFTVVDGEFAGKTYDHATEYETIPPEEKGKFERVSPLPSVGKPKGKGKPLTEEA